MFGWTKSIQDSRFARPSCCRPLNCADLGFVGLNLGHNKFSGSLPPEWTLMHPELEMLNLASNHISGSIPPEYSVFSNLQVL